MPELRTASFVATVGAPPGRQPSFRIVRSAAAVAIVATVVQSLATAVNLFVLDGSTGSVDATVEGGVWTWAASGATLVAAVSAAAIAVGLDRAPWQFGLLAAVLAFLSLDDSLVLHERVGEWFRDVLGTPEYVGGLWVLAYPPLLVVVAWGLWRTAKEVDPPVRRALLASLALLAAAVVVEFVGVGTKAFEESTGIAAPHDVRAIIEEGAELGAWILAAGGLLAALVAGATGTRDERAVARARHDRDE
jgi:hypothetical protein